MHGVHLPAECHALTCDVLVQAGDQSSNTTQSGSKFVFKFSTSGRMGQTSFLRLNVGAERRKLAESSSDAAQTPVFDYWSGARHANNMTPRGRRLGPEACVIIRLCASCAPHCRVADRRVECKKSVLQTETEIIQVKERG